MHNLPEKLPKAIKTWKVVSSVSTAINLKLLSFLLFTALLTHHIGYSFQPLFSKTANDYERNICEMKYSNIFKKFLETVTFQGHPGQRWNPGQLAMDRYRAVISFDLHKLLKFNRHFDREQAESHNYLGHVNNYKDQQRNYIFTPLIMFLGCNQRTPHYWLQSTFWYFLKDQPLLFRWRFHWQLQLRQNKWHFFKSEEIKKRLKIATVNS